MSKFENRKQQALERVKNDVTQHKKELEKIQQHTEQDCKDGKHITRGFATGGRRGEWMTSCLVCDWSTCGYD